MSLETQSCFEGSQMLVRRAQQIDDSRDRELFGHMVPEVELDEAVLEKRRRTK